MAAGDDDDDDAQDTAPPTDDALPEGIDGILADLPAGPVRRLLAFEKGKQPREIMLDYALDRIEVLRVRIRADGDKVINGWLRELSAMIKLRRLIEWMEREEMRKASEAKRSRR